MDIPNVVIWVAAGALLLLVLFLLTFLAVWVRARLAGAEVGLFDLVGMRLRGVPYSVIVDAKIAATKAGLSVDVEKIDAHYLAGGNIVQTVQALIAAQKAGLHLDWNRACAIDIATRGTNKSVLEAVLTSVSPKVIDCPNPSSGRTTIDAVAKDGIQVKVKARVTVRTNLDRFVGGAQEETIIARVGEGIVTTIGSSESYKFVLENPDRISKTVLERGLDANTAYEIMSIDIADVDVGDNIGAITRFILVSKPGSIPKSTGWDRTSLAVFIGMDHAGALLDILTEFAKRDVNLTFIQSRPTGLELGHYHFIIDAEGHIADTPVKEAVESLRAICEDIRFLGSYPREKASK